VSRVNGRRFTMNCLLAILAVVCQGHPAFPEGPVPGPGYDGSAGSVWLDRFLELDGMEYGDFLAELELFEQRTGPGWGRRPSTWRWVPRIREWEREFPEMEGLGSLLGRLDLEWSQHAYLDAITAWTDYRLEAVASTYRGDGGRDDFFLYFTGGGSWEPSTDLFAGDDMFRGEAGDIVAETVALIRGMLSPGQMETAASLVRDGGLSRRGYRY
jgi:hypothetical protein